MAENEGSIRIDGGVLGVGGDKVGRDSIVINVFLGGIDFGAAERTAQIDGERALGALYCGLGLSAVKELEGVHFVEQKTENTVLNRAADYYSDGGINWLNPGKLELMNQAALEKAFGRIRNEFKASVVDEISGKVSVSRPMALRFLAQACVIFGMFAIRLPDQVQQFYVEEVVCWVNECASRGALEKV